MTNSLKALLAKSLTSRKFMVMLLAVLGKVFTPVAAKYGIDLTPIGNALTEYMPLIIAWVLGQSAVDVAAAMKTPTSVSSSSADTTTSTTTVNQ